MWGQRCSLHTVLLPMTQPPAAHPPTLPRDSYTVAQSRRPTLTQSADGVCPPCCPHPGQTLQEHLLRDC